YKLLSNKSSSSQNSHTHVLPPEIILYHP
ncbi:hypothetical protein CP8484711_1693B, partial [Chlamydia psittaci 84-8471/1]